MNKSVSSLLAISLILIVPILIWSFLHNAIVSQEESVYSSWAQVESSYQRRSDLIPKLVETVSKYLKHESDTLTKITAARRQNAGAVSSLVDEMVAAQKASAEILQKHGGKVLEDEQALAALSQAQLKVGGGMQRMFGLVENYPELRSSDQFMELQGQLEGTENRINVARLRFNESVRDYNQGIRKLPGSLIARVGGFQRKAYFQADEGSKNAPEIDFN